MELTHTTTLLKRFGLALVLTVPLITVACGSSGDSVAEPADTPTPTPTPPPALTIGTTTIEVPDASLVIDFERRVPEIEIEEGLDVQRESFYEGDSLVFTSYDADDDGCQELWFVYDDEQFLTTEMHDTDGDCEPDRFIFLDREENVIQETSR